MSEKYLKIFLNFIKNRLKIILYHIISISVWILEIVKK